MADSQPFSNAGLDMFGTERGFASSAMRTQFDDKANILGNLIGKLLDTEETPAQIAQRLLGSGAVIPQANAPQGVGAAIPSQMIPKPPVANTTVAPAAPLVLPNPVEQADPNAPVSRSSFLPKPYMPGK